MEEEDLSFQHLALESVIGFNGILTLLYGVVYLLIGKIPQSFSVHPDRQHVVFALGCTVVIEEINTRHQDFLQGHTNNVDCVEISRNGEFIASGQVTYMGYKVYPDDQMFYCGTTTGDILGINMNTALLQIIAPEKNKYSLGITAIKTMPNSTILIGSGDGVIQEYQVKFERESQRSYPNLIRTKQEQKLVGGITAISLRGNGHQFYVATDKCHLYRFNHADFSYELTNTCHYAAVNDIKFPKNCSDLFATCSYQDVRVFNTTTQQELLRINIPNMTCYCLDILADGTAIISACNRIISGGGEGHVRIWDIKEMRPSGKPTGRCQHRRLDRKQAGDETGIPESTFVTVLVAAMHEHTNAVSCIQISKDDRSCVSASADSTCIIWCLETFRRRQIIFSNTLFRCICYHPTECQVITSGTDRKIGYWEVYDGSLIRQLDGSRSGSVNGMDITEDGKTFVTSGDDKIVK
ncbi:uncharacterized protein DEA37_0000354, partial [Paragonimus westermani]